MCYSSACRFVAQVRAPCTSWTIVLLAAAGFKARRLQCKISSSCLSLHIHVAWMSKPCQIKQVWSITGGRLKKTSTWLAKTKEVEDRLFVRIDKWDRHFIQFVTGQPLELRKEKDSNTI